MNGFRISLFRQFECYYESSSIFGLHSQKVQELLSYLLILRERPHSRELLASTLWDNGSLSRAKKNLRQVLWQINATMEETNIRQDRMLLVADNDWIQINMGANIWMDIAVFDAAYESTKSIHGRDLNAEQVAALDGALKLYRGQLLEGWFYDWCIYERERLHDIYLSLLDKLLGYSEAHNDYNTGMAYGSMVLRWDPARERTHRRLMRLQYATGRRTEALRQFQVCVDALREDFGVTPGRHTMLLHEQIRNNLPVQELAVVDSPSSRQTGGAIDDAAAGLDQVERTLHTLQEQIEQLKTLLENPRS